MSHIEEVLSRALLVRERTLPRDIVPPTARTRRYNTWSPALRPADNQRRAQAAEDLHNLCEALITHLPTATAAEFVTDQVPEPRGALLLACMLQLTDSADGARYWWQYAAGAGMPAAAYCLYLHHLTLGENTTADWWHRQTDDVQPPPETQCPTRTPAASPYRQDDEVPATTILRFLLHVVRCTARHRSAVITQLMAYIPDAVAIGYLRQPEIELPLPGRGFATRVRFLLTGTGSTTSQSSLRMSANSYEDTQHDRNAIAPTQDPGTPPARPHREQTAAR
ncbi:hypothetical protein ACIP10_34595 [Streptomyces galbus]|uniref:hypothetical protein n=1 Tax=Streptomyces galbus TaxID=33898 RepID=UPI0037FA748F